MTNTDNRMPATEALGEALAALNGERERFREERAVEVYHSNPALPETYRLFTADAERLQEHLANSGWVLAPGPVVNAGEDRP